MPVTRKAPKRFASCSKNRSLQELSNGATFCIFVSWVKSENSISLRTTLRNSMAIKQRRFRRKFFGRCES